MRILRVWQRRARSDEGMSLVELLVAMGISLFVMAGVSAMAITGIRTSAATNVRNDATDQLRRAQDRLTKQIRTATPLSAADPAVLVAEPERFAFYAQLDSLNLKASNPGTQAMAPSAVWLWTRTTADGRRELCQQIYKATIAANGDLNWPAGAKSATATRSCQVVSRGLASAVAQPRPTFTYLAATDTTFRTDGSSISSLPVVGAGANVGAIRDTSLESIKSVEIWLTADIRERSNIKDPSMVARVTLPNNL